MPRIQMSPSDHNHGEDGMCGVEAQPPSSIGRFDIEAQLGAGTFGIVYRAHDPELHRDVALKLFRPELSDRFGEGVCTSEARALAQLSHPGIVRVYEAGTDPTWGTYVVSELIEGTTLADYARQGKIRSHEHAATLVAQVARALDYAHRRERVHRDLNPGNIMINEDGDPVLIDFGIALVGEVYGVDWGRHMGTPPYVSPEQARGEGHRVDGRADVFSLAVVLYELLVKKLPFDGKTIDLVADLQTAPVEIPRTIDSTIPRALESICLCGLSKLPSDRFPSAAAMAEELESFLAQGSAPEPTTRSWTEQDVPRGLQPFDRSTSEFYLASLPGTRRGGLPECIRFWKSRIESTDPAEAFRVGLLYGPSGSGKSSLINAGILPQLENTVTPVLVEAAGEIKTEEQIVSALHRKFLRLDDEHDLPALLRKIREGHGPPIDCKVLLVIDQFEQHLQFNQASDRSLLGALRQCDGARVQALLLVRSEFWLGVSNLFQQLEQDLDTGENAAAVNLFERDHAIFVLTGLGRACGQLPAAEDQLTRDHRKFLQLAVEQLSEKDEITPVRLALFAEMFRQRDWTPAELKRAGGAEGIGVAFLEHSLRQAESELAGQGTVRNAQQILSILLPEGPLDIKGPSRSRSDLFARVDLPESSFERLLHLLESRLRVIGKIDPVEGDREDRYQLTHDFLVPSIRTLLEREQRKTRRGRAHLELARATELWSEVRERKMLPSLPTWLRIRLFTRSHRWSEQEQRLMKTAGRLYLFGTAAAAAVLLLLVLTGMEIASKGRSDSLLTTVLTTSTPEVVTLADELHSMQRHLVPRLEQAIHGGDLSGEELLRVEIAHSLLRSDRHASLEAQLFNLEPEVIVSIHPIVAPFGQSTLAEAADLVANPDTSRPRQLRASLVLFLHDSSEGPARRLVDRLLELEVESLSPWIVPLQGRSKALVPILEQIVLAPSSIARPDLAESPDPERARQLWSNATAAEAQRNAKAAIILALLGKEAAAWQILQDPPIFEARSWCILWLASAGVAPTVLVGSLEERPSEAVASGLLQALAHYSLDSIANPLRGKMTTLAQEWHENTPRARIRASAAYTLRRWRVGAAPPPAKRGWQSSMKTGDWFTGPNDHEMVILPPIDGRVVAISMYELTNSQFLKFDTNFKLDNNFNRLLEGPAGGIHLYRGMEYCNWLSGLSTISRPPCYDRRGNAVLPYPDYLDRPGYRLPTPHEWRTSCRANTQMEMFYGNSDELDLIGEYVSHRLNVPGYCPPVGTRKPNRFGIFDSIGSCYEWAHTEGDPRLYGNHAVTMGGSISDRPRDIYAPTPLNSIPASKTLATFRVALTLKSAGQESE